MRARNKSILPELKAKAKCKECGQKLGKIQGDVYTLICNNWKCSLNHRPQGKITKEQD